MGVARSLQQASTAAGASADAATPSVRKRMVHGAAGTRQARRPDSATRPNTYHARPATRTGPPVSGRPPRPARAAAAPLTANPPRASQASPRPHSPSADTLAGRAYTSVAATPPT